MKKYQRSLDPLGRIAIPKEILNANFIEDGALFNIKAVPDGILLTPVDGTCTLCGGLNGLIKDSSVCKACLVELAQKENFKADS